MFNWYVLYTSARAEKQVEQRLKLLDIEAFLPMHFSPRRWSDRVKMVEVPLFSSYIFVRTTDAVLRTLLSVAGVSRIVFFNAQPAIVSPKEIAAIAKFLTLAKERELEYNIDEEVLIACGPMKDIAGKIKKIGKEYIILYIEQLGSTVCVSQKQLVKK